MYRSAKCDRDSYITDKIVRGARVAAASVGQAGTIDLFKLSGVNTSGSLPLIETSRALVHFDLSDLTRDYQNGLFDVSSSTFNCTLRLRDVYAGQTTPRNFTLAIYPLSRSWQEGRGRDVVYYQDSDVVNFLTASYSNGTPSVWHMSGANAKGLLGSSNIDVISSGNLGAGIVNLFVTQSFVDGTEDLEVNVTRIVSATLAGQIPDHGFRISFEDSHENDAKTYFVKRFGSRQAIDVSVRPELVLRYDDSVVSHQSSFYFNTSGTILLNNTVRGKQQNLVSGTLLTPIAGSACALVKLWSSDSSFVQYVTASQHRIGTTNVTGLYSASFAIASNDSRLTGTIARAMLTSSDTPVRLNETWLSMDTTVAYHSATLDVRLPESSVSSFRPRQYHVNVPNVANEYDANDVVRLSAYVFDRNNPYYRFVRVPTQEPSVNLETHYSIRDVVLDEVVIPFDRTYNSTRMSFDGEKLFFDVWAECLQRGRSYVIDVMIVDGDQEDVHYDASPAFRIALS